MARPFEKLPPGSRDALLAMARTGLRESTAATALGIPLHEFRRVITKNPEAKALWTEALSVERDALINALFNKAMEGDAKSAQYLLAARHGMSEKTTESPGERVNITFQLPKGMYSLAHRGCLADDAIFAKTGHGAGSIADEFMRAGIRFSPAKKADRLTGWNIMRRLLSDASKPDVPGLYISRNCFYFWDTVPYLGRDQKRVEDVDSSGADHGADAVRYGCLRIRNEAKTSKIYGV